jgi:ketosteroid isomerase-like protein
VNDAPSPDPVEVFRGATAAIVTGDLDRAMSYLHEDIVLDWSRSRGPLQGVHRGTDGARKVWEDMLEAWEPTGWDIEVVGRPDPETVVVESRPQARGRGSGIEMGGRGGIVVRIRDGKLIAVTLFQSPEEALAEANDTTSR